MGHCLAEDDPVDLEIALQTCVTIFYQVGLWSYFNCTTLALAHRAHWKAQGSPLTSIFLHPKELSEEKAEILIGFLAEQQAPFMLYQFAHVRSQWLELSILGTAVRGFDMALQQHKKRQYAARGNLVWLARQWLLHLVEFLDGAENAWVFRPLSGKKVTRNERKVSSPNHWVLRSLTGGELEKRIAHALKLLQLEA